MRLARPLCAALLAAGLATGCSSSSDAAEPASAAAPSATATSPGTATPTAEAPADAPAEEPAEQVVITISDFAFDVPATVPPGAEVTVVNEDSSFHTVTAEDGSFDVPAPGGETVTFTAPEEPGEYAFRCTPHANMTATLVVG